MNVTIAINLQEDYINDHIIESINAIYKSPHKKDGDNIVFVTHKKRYELPAATLTKINSTSAALITGATQHQNTLASHTQNILFEIDDSYTLHELSFEYIRNFYEHNMPCVTIPQNIRDLFMYPSPAKDTTNDNQSFLISCIIPVYNSESYLHEAIDSILAQTIKFEQNIQLILVNDGSTDNSENICQKYTQSYPNNILLLSQPNQGVSAARNVGINAASGKYLAFLDSDDMLDMQYFAVGLELFKKYEQDIDIVAYPFNFFDAREGRTHPLDYCFTKTQLIDVTQPKHHSFIKANAASALIKREAVGSLRFETDMKYAEDGYFITQILRKKHKYAVTSDACYNYRKRHNATSALDLSTHSIGWYDKLFAYCGRLIDQDIATYGHATPYIQHLVMYDIQWYKLPTIPNEILLTLDKDAMLTEIARILKHIDDSIIRAQKFISYWQKIFLLELKHGKSKLAQNGELPAFYIGGVKREGVNPSTWISIVEEYGGTITISGSYCLLNPENIELVAKYNGEIYTCTFHDVMYRSEHFFGEARYKSSVFDLHIPLGSGGTIALYTRVKGYGLFPVRLNYTFTCRMRNKTSAFVIGEQSIIKHNEFNSFDVCLLNFTKLCEHIDSYALHNFQAEEYSEDLGLLKLYQRLYHSMQGRRIWLFLDRPGKADDNAEHLFRYAAHLNDGIEKYFVLEEGSPDYTRMQHFGNVVPFGSSQHKILHLFAEKYISAAFDFSYIFPFGADNRIELFQGLCNAKFIFLQHGITKDDMSQVLNKWVRNAKLFVTTTEDEYQSILSSEYGYTTDQVKLLGFPRFDGLQDKSQKQILFLFTWRKDLAQRDPTSGMVYNSTFKNSHYFKSIHGLLYNQELQQAAKRYGYKLVFRPHPAVYVQLQDFDNASSAITIVPNEESYQELYANASLAITDYSSAIFDFAYLKKPIVYYQFDNNNWDSGYFDYETMGFGEVFSDESDVVQAIIKHMENDCTISEQYLQRIENFFTFGDKDNCKRVYDAIINME